MSAPPGILPLYLRQAMTEQYGLLTKETGEMARYKVIPKDLILNDIGRQGVYNDFTEFKAKINGLNYNDLLFVHDPDGKYDGSNYLLCLNQEIANQQMEILKEAERVQQQQAVAATAAAEEEVVEEKVFVYEEHVFDPRPWVSLGSEVEVDQLITKPSRPLIGYRVSRRRRDFNKKVDFADMEAHDKVVDLRKQIVTNFDTKRTVLDIGLQATADIGAHMMVDNSCQTNFTRSVNKAVQYRPVFMKDQQRDELSKSLNLNSFLSKIAPFCEVVLAQNATVNIFSDDFRAFQQEDVGNKTENNIKDLYTLSDINYSKHRNISWIDWYPNSSSLVGVSCSPFSTFDARVENCGKITRSHILIWSLNNLITPYLVLEAPGDIQCFQFNPDRPDIVIGGLANGQIVLWDISVPHSELREFEASKKMKVSKADKAVKTALEIIEMEDEAEHNNKLGSVPIQPLLLSNIEKGHPRAVTDIKWLPKKMEVNRRGDISAVNVKDNSYSSQFVSVAADGFILFWDLRQVVHEKGIRGTQTSLTLGSAIAIAASVAAQNQALSDNPDLDPKSVKGSENSSNPTVDDIKWIPIFSLPLSRDIEISPVRLCINETSSFQCVTEEGEFVIGDWIRKEEEDEKKKGPVVKQILKGHFGSCLGLARSPFFDDIFLTCGDWMFNIWKLGVDVPIFSSPMFEEYIVSCSWSPTRPSVFVTALANGNIHFWDLSDQSHRPVNTQSITSNPISFLKYCTVNNSQLLAVGDSQGDLHILDIPRNLRRKLANENDLMSAFFTREVNRINYYKNKPANIAPVHEEEKKLEAFVLDEKAEAAYQKLLAKFKQDFGLA